MMSTILTVTILGLCIMIFIGIVSRGYSGMMKISNEGLGHLYLTYVMLVENWHHLKSSGLTFDPYTGNI